MFFSFYLSFVFFFLQICTIKLVARFTKKKEIYTEFHSTKKNNRTKKNILPLSGGIMRKTTTTIYDVDADSDHDGVMINTPITNATIRRCQQ